MSSAQGASYSQRAQSIFSASVFMYCLCINCAGGRELIINEISVLLESYVFQVFMTIPLYDGMMNLIVYCNNLVVFSF